MQNFLSRLLAVAVIFATMNVTAAELIRVLIWDERQPTQKEAYENFLGNAIGDHLKAQGGIELRSVAMDDPEQGLTDDNLNWAQVLIWWGHARHGQVRDDAGPRVLERLQDGRLNLIALHSAHFAKPFVAAMNWRAVEDAKTAVQKANPDKVVVVEAIEPAPQSIPVPGSQLTPAWFATRMDAKRVKVQVHLPYCVFPSWRHDGKPSRMQVMLLGHPIARGLGSEFKVSATEMYAEPFHVPAPDQVIFTEYFEGGEWFRGGMVWNIGKGRVFYFRPGHETYPVIKQMECLRVMENAVRWMGAGR
jgi:trehalose utilization protein